MKIQELKTVYHSTQHDVDEFYPLSHFGTPGTAEEMFRQRSDYAINDPERDMDPYRTYRVNIDMKSPAIMWDTRMPHDAGEILKGLLYHVEQIAYGQLDEKYEALVSEEDLYELKQTPLNYTVEDLMKLKQKWDKEYSKLVDDYLYSTKEHTRMEKEHKQELIMFLKEFGHDGIKYINRSESRGDWSYIALDPMKAESMNEALVAPPPEERVPFIKWWAKNLKKDPKSAGHALSLMYGHVNYAKSEVPEKAPILHKLRWQFQQALRRKRYEDAANLYHEFTMQARPEVLVASESTRLLQPFLKSMILTELTPKRRASRKRVKALLLIRWAQHELEDHQDELDTGGWNWDPKKLSDAKVNALKDEAERQGYEVMHGKTAIMIDNPNPTKMADPFGESVDVIFEEAISEARFQDYILHNLQDAVEQTLVDFTHNPEQPKYYFNSEVYGDPYSDNEDEDHRFEAWLRDHAAETVDDAANRIESGVEVDPHSGEIVIYRRVDAEERWPGRILAKNIGVFWAWNERDAEAHWSQGGTPYLVTGTVSPEHVDWASTVSLNVQSEEESEIRLYDDAPITLVNVSVKGQDVNPEIYPHGEVMKASVGEGLNEAVNDGRTSIWYNPKNNQAITEPGYAQHSRMVIENPEFFPGVNVNEPYTAMNQHGYIRGVLYHAAKYLSVEAAVSTDVVMFIEWVIKQFGRLNDVAIDTEDYDNEIEGEQIDRVIMAGRLTEAYNPDVTYSIWYNPQTHDGVVMAGYARHNTLLAKNPDFFMDDPEEMMSLTYQAIQQGYLRGVYIRRDASIEANDKTHVAEFVKWISKEFGRIDQLSTDIPGYDRWIKSDEVDRILMTGRLQDKFTEAKQAGPLYHYTNLQQAVKIMNDGYIKGSKSMRTGIPKIDLIPQVSATRNPNYHKVVGLMPTTGDVRFLLDGDKISNNYKVIPVKGGLVTYTRTGAHGDEFEETIITDRLPLYSFLKKVDINTDQVDIEHDELHVSAVKTMAQKQNVPVGAIGTGWRAEPVQRESTRFGLVGFSKYIFEGSNDWAIWFNPRTGQHMKGTWNGISDHKDMITNNPDWFADIVPSQQHGSTTDAVDSGYIRGVFFGNSRNLDIQTYSSEGVADFIRSMYKEFRRIDAVYIDSSEGYTNRSLTGDEIDNIVATGELPRGYFQESVLTELKHNELESLIAAIDSGEGAFNWMEENGWENVGNTNSVFSNVYGKASSPWVIKILREPAQMGISESDRCALQWLRFCNKNWQSNPHLPVVAFVKTIDAKDFVGNRKLVGRTYMAVIERLVQAEDEHWRKGFGINAKLDAYQAASLLALNVSFGGDHELANENIERIINYYPALGDQVAGMNEWQRKEALNQYDVISKAAADGYPLAVAVKYALAMGESHCSMDLHRYNTMARPSTGDLVITDPVRG